MFHAPDDTESIKNFKTVVENQLLSEKRKCISTLIQQIFVSQKLNMVSSFAENINFLTADGKRFAHPLHHLGKSQADLPLIAIDSFRHMYLFKDYNDIFVDGKLKKFVEDLHSGKLHRYANFCSNVVLEIISYFTSNIYKLKSTFCREFHYGPEESEQAEKSEPEKSEPEKSEGAETNEVEEVKVTTPPESTFKKLAPSKNRYTLLRDEL